MICPDAMQAVVGPPVVMAERGGRVSPVAGHAATVTFDAAESAGKTFWLQQSRHNPLDKASRLKSPLFERSDLPFAVTRCIPAMVWSLADEGRAMLIRETEPIIHASEGFDYSKAIDRMLR